MKWGNDARVTVFCGAGFSSVAGVPLGCQLFDEAPAVDTISRERLVERVVRRWCAWQGVNGRAPEQYLSYLQDRGGTEWRDALKFVALRIALAMGSLQTIGWRTRLTRHQIYRTTGVPAHEEFWRLLGRLAGRIAVITTNYDVLCERGLRISPRPKVGRAGFNYGSGAERLEGRGFPTFPHLQPVRCTGGVPLFKLHGSVSWSVENGDLVKYLDCRPAARGDAAIVAPASNKNIPEFLEETWHAAAAALRETTLLLVVGYSLPDYDTAVRDLLRRNVVQSIPVHVFDPCGGIVERYREILPDNSVMAEPGLPECLSILSQIICEPSAASVVTSA